MPGIRTRSKAVSCITEHSISAYTTYLAAGGKKDKKGGKDVKKADAKQKPGGKEKDRVYGWIPQPNIHQEN